MGKNGYLRLSKWTHLLTGTCRYILVPTHCISTFCMPCTRVHKLARMSQCSGGEILTSMRATRAQSCNLMMHSSMVLSLAREQHMGVKMSPLAPGLSSSFYSSHCGM